MNVGNHLIFDGTTADHYNALERLKVKMAKLFSITEPDLIELERMLPAIADDLMSSLRTRQKVQFRRVQHILSNVRWNYGPPLQCKTVPAGPDGPAGTSSEDHAL